MPRRFIGLALAICGLSFTAFSRDTYPRATSIDVLHYRIQLEVKDTGNDIAAETEILFAFNDSSTTSISLDFADLAVDAVTENNRPAKFTRSVGQLNIQFQGQYTRGDRGTIGVRYHGKPVDGLFFKKNNSGERTIFADNFPNLAHNWFPSIDHPYDKATVEFIITAPDRFEVVANGTLVETTKNSGNTKTTHWKEEAPIPVYCMVFAATNYSIVDAGSWNAIPITYYLYPKDRERGVKDFSRVLQMAEFYSNLIGPFPYEKLALVQTPTEWGGMENASNIFLNQTFFDGTGAMEPVFAHEIAHQWFGDAVTESDWHHLWLSESFATYFGALFFEHADGRGRFLEMMLADKTTYLKQYSRDPRPMHDPKITDLVKLANANNYQKGSWVLHMLRHLMGDEKFFAGIRDYYRTYRDRSVLTSDFQQTMETHAGRPLDWFFRQWVFEPGYPVYEAGWSWNESRKEVRLHITQKQGKTVFRMPLDVEIGVGGTPRHEIAEVNAREQVFTYRLDRKPSGLAIDPEEWVLKVLSLKEEK